MRNSPLERRAWRMKEADRVPPLCRRRPSVAIPPKAIPLNRVGIFASSQLAAAAAPGAIGGRSSLRFLPQLFVSSDDQPRGPAKGLLAGRAIDPAEQVWIEAEGDLRLGAALPAALLRLRRLLLERLDDGG